MKLANTFLTCTGSTGMQWQHLVKGHVVSQLTFWKDGKNKVCHTSFGRIVPADYDKAFNHFMAQ